MKIDKDLVKRTFVTVTIAVGYVFGVSQLMQNGSKLFGETDNMLTPFAVLLLFVFSAAVMGGLLLGQPVMLYLDNKKKEGVLTGLYSIAWLGFYTVLAFLSLALIKG